MDNRFMKKIDELYDFTYTSKYGPDWLLSIFLLLITYGIVMYLHILDKKDEIAENWNKVRCEPQNMLLAGQINPPKDGSMSSTEFTKHNFQGCLNEMASETAWKTTSPYMNNLSFLTDVYSSFGESVNGIRGYLAGFRDKFTDFVETILGQVMNMFIEFQKLFVSVKDFGNKILGIMTSAIMGTLGLYYTLVSGFKALFTLIAAIVVAATVLAIAAAFSIFGWPISVALLVLMGVLVSMLVAMASGFPPVMGGLRFPRPPRKPRIPKPRFPRWLCFDKDTEVKMNNNTTKKISEIKLGDKLLDNDYVYATFKLSGKHEKDNMYKLDDTIVSGDHKVLYLGEYINVKDHKDSKKIDYNKSQIYNLVTFSKTIPINNMKYKDYDEMTVGEIRKLDNSGIIKKGDIYKNNGLFKKFIGGFHEDTELKLLNGCKIKIKDIKVYDVLDDNTKVLGVVEIDTSELEPLLIKDINTHSIICSKNILHYNSLGKISTVENTRGTILGQVRNSKKVYHLLTDTNYFYVNFLKFYDYDYLIDYYLE